MRRANRRAQRDTITVTPQKISLFLYGEISCDHQWRYSCVHKEEKKTMNSGR